MNKPLIKIAIAEDHAALREGIVSLFGSTQHIKVIADSPNGAELLANFLQLRQLPDIALLDIDMPVMDGYATAREIRSKYPAVKTVAFSFHRNEFNIIKMIKNGAVAYLTKGSTSFAQIVKTIEAVYTKGYYCSDVVTDELFEKAKSTMLPEFTTNEMQFLTLCCDGLSDKEIADQMFLSPRSVEYYHATVRDKLKISRRVEMVAFVLKTGIVSSES